jgi:hypothetical protein
LLVVLSAIAVPAGVLQAVCAGRSCEEPSGEAPRVPFCPLPAAIREGIVNGYRERRSPDVLGVAAHVRLFNSANGTRPGAPWPSLDSPVDARVPLAFWGAGVASGASVPDGSELDQVAPTIAEAIALNRPFPEVRSGVAIEGVAGGARPRLVLLVAWKGVGSSDLEAVPEDWPFLGSMFAEGAGSLETQTGSLPLDPAATLTTIGTGGLPSQHGITGSFVRNDDGEVVPAFGDGAPVTVIATLADDLEQRSGGALVGLVATDESDRGVVGGGWYPDQDPVDVVIGGGAAAPLSVDVHLSTGYGADDVPDVIGVVMEGSIRSLDARTRRIVNAARLATEDSVLVVVAGTGSLEGSRAAVPDSVLVRAVDAAVPGDASAVAATVPGGIFLDQATLVESQVSGQVAVEALLGVTGPDGRKMMADAFQGYAVSFERYC